MDLVQEAVEQTQCLTFYVAGEEYAIGILRVKEIIEYDTPTKVPAIPACIRGVINLRGNVVPVVDLAVKLGLPESPITKRTCIIIVEVNLEGEWTVMGVIADTIGQVMDLLPQDIEVPPPFGTQVRADHLFGLGKIGRKFVLILDIDRVLSTNGLLAVASVQATATEIPSQPDGGPPQGEEASVS
ncbi:MAG: chemotaxis protein CheW [Candidatus Methylomirabilales bacterium]